MAIQLIVVEILSLVQSVGLTSRSLLLVCLYSLLIKCSGSQITVFILKPVQLIPQTLLAP